MQNKLEQMGIYELRSVARKFGVPSPTSKKRQELIDAIIAIQNGEQKPNYRKFGRPVKNVNLSNNLFSDFVVSDDTELADLIKNGECEQKDNCISFEQEFDADNLLLTKNTAQVKGVLRVTNQGTFYMLNYNKIGEKLYVVFEQSIIEQNKLVEGDFVEGSAFVATSKNYAKMNEVFKVNGVMPKEQQIDENQEYIIPQYTLTGFSILQGQNRLCKVDGDVVDCLDFINRHAKQLVPEGYKCVVLGLEISVETKLKLNRIEGITDVFSLYDDTSNFSFERMNDALKHVLSLFNHKQKVVLFVMDIFSIYHILDLYYGNTLSDIHAENSEIFVKKILCCNRASNDASISTLGLYYEGQEQSFAKEFEQLKKITN